MAEDLTEGLAATASPRIVPTDPTGSQIPSLPAAGKPNLGLLPLTPVPSRGNSIRDSYAELGNPGVGAPAWGSSRIAAQTRMGWTRVSPPEALGTDAESQGQPLRAHTLTYMQRVGGQNLRGQLVALSDAQASATH